MDKIHPKHPHHWLIILCLAMVLMVVLAFAAQRPDLTQKIPGFGPSATPTPLVSKNIIVKEPYGDGFISQEFIISGRAKANEQGVMIRLSDKLSGEIYGETSFQTTNIDASGFGDFSGKIAITNPNLKSGQAVLLDLFLQDTNGHETDKITIPLRFTPSGESIIK